MIHPFPAQGLPFVPAGSMRQSPYRPAPNREQGLVIVGAGPAGLAPLLAAASIGKLSELLEQGITLVERSGDAGAGALSRYTVGSDSTALTFLDVLKGTSQPELRALEAHPAAQRLQQLGTKEAPLAVVAEWLQVVSGALLELVRQSRHGRVLTNTDAVYLKQRPEGGWTVETRQSGCSGQVYGRRVLLCTGAHQPVHRLQQERVAGVPLLPRFGHKLLQSGVLLSTGGAELVAARLHGQHQPKVAIVGGSTSAAASAVMLLREMPGLPLGRGAVSLLHRKPFRICYESVQEAVAAGDRSFTSDDVCPLTQRVNRFSGLRLASRELLMRAQGLGTGPVEPRLQLVPIPQQEPSSALRLLEGADLVVAAIGYRPLLLPVQDAQGREVSLHQPTPEDWPVVDGRFRVRTREGGVLEDLFASGLAVGPMPDRQLGGERGYSGQVNSLWMWQHNLGWRLLRELLAPVQKVRYRGMSKAPYMPTQEPLNLAISSGSAH